MTILEIENLKCNGCKNTITKSLLKIEGIGEVNVDLDANSISFSGNASIELVEKELEKLGYPIKGKNNFWNKTKSVVSCATGKF